MRSTVGEIRTTYTPSRPLRRRSCPYRRADMDLPALDSLAQLLQLLLQRGEGFSAQGRRPVLSVKPSEAITTFM